MPLDAPSRVSHKRPAERPPESAAATAEMWSPMSRGTPILPCSCTILTTADVTEVGVMQFNARVEEYCPNVERWRFLIRIQSCPAEALAVADFSQLLSRVPTVHARRARASSSRRELCSAVSPWCQIRGPPRERGRGRRAVLRTASWDGDPAAPRVRVWSTVGGRGGRWSISCADSGVGRCERCIAAQPVAAPGIGCSERSVPGSELGGEGDGCHRCDLSPPRSGGAWVRTLFSFWRGSQGGARDARV